MNVRARLREAFCAFLYYSGSLKLLERLIGTDCIILAYHRVLPEKCEDIQFIQPGMYVTTTTFEKHMRYISSHYRVITLESLMHEHEVNNCCVVTFDDGWKDNYEYALPILRKYGVHATIFLTTAFIGTNQWPWSDRMSYYFRYASPSELQGMMQLLCRSGLSDESFHSISKVRFPHDRRMILESLISSLKRFPPDRISSIMDGIDRSLKALSDSLHEKRPWLCWEEVREMSDTGISFGSHSHNHVILTNVKLETVEREIESSMNILETQLSKPVNMFSYPNGNHNDEIMQLLGRKGFEIAVTTRSGRFNYNSRLLSISRLMMHNDMTRTIPMFVRRICS